MKECGRKLLILTLATSALMCCALVRADQKTVETPTVSILATESATTSLPSCGGEPLGKNVDRAIAGIGGSIHQTLAPPDGGIDLVGGAVKFAEAVATFFGSTHDYPFAACALVCGLLPTNATVTEQPIGFISYQNQPGLNSPPWYYYPQAMAGVGNFPDVYFDPEHDQRLINITDNGGRILGQRLLYCKRVRSWNANRIFVKYHIGYH